MDGPINIPSHLNAIRAVKWLHINRGGSVMIRSADDATEVSSRGMCHHVRGGGDSKYFPENSENRLQEMDSQIILCRV